MQFVDEAVAQILLDGGHAAAQPDVLVARRLLSPLQRGLDPVGDEVEYRAALHADRRAGVMGQHEDIAMIGRFLAPPSLPLIIRPRTSHRTEHVAAQYPSADIGKAALSKIVVGAFSAAVLSEQ